MNNDNNKGYLQTPLRREDAHRRHKSTRLRKRICLGLLIVSLVCVYSTCAYAYNLLGKAKVTIEKTYTKSHAKKLRNVSDILKQKKPISVLLLGTDTGDLGRSDTGRTDTIIVATVNPKTKRVSLTSIPRDTQVKIPGSKNSYDKINSAYTIGGVSTAVETVQNTLDIPIDYYILLNMGGLRKVVDALGGVEITPLLTFHYENANVVKDQTVTLDGKSALDYSRMRYDDPEGDYGRQKRQKQVIEAIIKKAMSITSLTRYEKLLKTIEDNMQTDLSYDDMIEIETNYKDAGKHVESYVLQGDGETIDGLSYQVASAEEKQDISNKIRKELGLQPSQKEFTGRIYSSGYAETSSNSTSGTNTSTYSSTTQSYSNYSNYSTYSNSQSTRTTTGSSSHYSNSNVQTSQSNSLGTTTNNSENTGNTENTGAHSSSSIVNEASSSATTSASD